MAVASRHARRPPGSGGTTRRAGTVHAPEPPDAQGGPHRHRGLLLRDAGVDGPPTRGTSTSRTRAPAGRRSCSSRRTTFSGSGMVAVLTYGNPVLRVDMPTFVDMQSAVLWSGGLQSSVRKTAKLGAVVGRGSGEAYQLALSGEGIVVVQTSEGHPAPSSGS
ncbi:AIM24 family protein [Phycicoccus sp. CSK15P-2]|uniref:AIM24 family protein n=1 Tax=Phycicoccus sp. CSK15P-2 TaxID=2807627 RepID=UPI002101E4BB|nr:AIM24 family protein [Phycicoccus sp. CSK15P-2]